jgi:hypothetical protein
MVIYAEPVVVVVHVVGDREVSPAPIDGHNVTIWIEDSDIRRQRIQHG